MFIFLISVKDGITLNILNSILKFSGKNIVFICLALIPIRNRHNPDPDPHHC
jgi:hypothetical protein